MVRAITRSVVESPLLARSASVRGIFPHLGRRRAARGRAGGSFCARHLASGGVFVALRPAPPPAGGAPSPPVLCASDAGRPAWRRLFAGRRLVQPCSVQPLTANSGTLRTFHNSSGRGAAQFSAGEVQCQRLSAAAFERKRESSLSLCAEGGAGWRPARARSHASLSVTARAWGVRLSSLVVCCCPGRVRSEALLLWR